MKHQLKSAIGNVIEWYDFALYGYFGFIFAELFFPATMPKWLSLIASYGIFAIGFLARPLGGLIFGYLGDLYGRRLALMITPILMSCFTALIALLPTYEYAGPMSTITLIVLRVLQGICMGGEFAGNMIYLVESSPKKYYIWGSIASCTGSIGIMLASGMAAWISKNFSHILIENWAWRIAFLASIPLGAIVYWLRKSMVETAAFIAIDHKLRVINPLKFAISHHKSYFILAIGIIYLHATSFYFIFIYLPISLKIISGMNHTSAILSNTTFLFMHILCIPIFGLLTQRFGGKVMLQISASIFIIFSYPIYTMIVNSGSFAAQIGIGFFSILSAINAGVVPGLLVKILPTHTRYTILALSYNIGFGILGGLTPFFCLLLVHHTNDIMSSIWYLIFAASLTFFSSFFITLKSS